MEEKFIIITIVLLFFTISCTSQKEETNLSPSVRQKELRDKLKQQLGVTYNQPIPEATGAQLDRGRALYDQLCASCHGHRGNGEGVNNNALVYKPSDLSDRKQAHFFSEQARLHIITNGIEGSAMISWKNILPEKDLLSVYVYTRSLIKN